MAGPLYPHAFENLVREDIEWLKKNSPDSLERRHIIAICERAVEEYKNGGYDRAMMEHRG